MSKAGGAPLSCLECGSSHINVRGTIGFLRPIDPITRELGTYELLRAEEVATCAECAICGNDLTQNLAITGVRVA